MAKRLPSFGGKVFLPRTFEPHCSSSRSSLGVGVTGQGVWDPCYVPDSQHHWWPPHNNVYRAGCFHSGHLFFFSTNTRCSSGTVQALSSLICG